MTRNATTVKTYLGWVPRAALLKRSRWRWEDPPRPCPASLPCGKTLEGSPRKTRCLASWWRVGCQADISGNAGQPVIHYTSQSHWNVHAPVRSKHIMEVKRCRGEKCTWLKTSSEMISQSTLYLQMRQDAVANEPVTGNKKMWQCLSRIFISLNLFVALGLQCFSF